MNDNSLIPISNIFDSSGLEENVVSAKFAHTAADGKTYQTYISDFDKTVRHLTGKSDHGPTK